MDAYRLLGETGRHEEDSLCPRDYGLGPGLYTRISLNAYVM